MSVTDRIQDKRPFENLGIDTDIGIDIGIGIFSKFISKYEHLCPLHVNIFSCA